MKKSNLKISWVESKDYLNKSIYTYTNAHWEYIISSRFSNYSLSITNSCCTTFYVGEFTMLKKAQKVVEMIVKG